MKNKIFIVLFILFLIPLRVYAFPQYVEIFKKDKFARPEMKNMCSICHTNPGGPLNDFGKAFDANGHKITDNLRKQFPELFNLIQSLAPKIIRIKPSMVALGKQVEIIITGTNFANDSIVKIDGNSENVQSTFINPKRINLTIAFNEVGVHTIQVVNIVGQASNISKIKVKPLKTK